MKSLYWNLAKELQSSYNLSTSWSVWGHFCRICQSFSISPFSNQFHFPALMKLHWFGIDWHALRQSEFRNWCLCIITIIRNPYPDVSYGNLLNTNFLYWIHENVCENSLKNKLLKIVPCIIPRIVYSGIYLKSALISLVLCATTQLLAE